jgi:hypothetical protein
MTKDSSVGLLVQKFLHCGSRYVRFISWYKAVTHITYLLHGAGHYLKSL